MSTYKEFSLMTGREGFYNITKEISAFVAESGVRDGMVLVFCPHTTAAIIINENSDPDVMFDLSYACSTFSPGVRIPCTDPFLTTILPPASSSK